VVGGLGFALAPRLPAAVATTLFGGTGESVLGVAGHRGVLYFALVGLAAVPALVVVCGPGTVAVDRIDWETLLLFGGGISLADALADTGATAWLADAVFGAVGGVPLAALVAVVVLLTVVLSELASNTATVAVLAPLLVELGPRYAAGADGVAVAVALTLAGGLAASYGFALPVATPPNAIAFGSGELRREEMLRAGVTLDVLLGAVTTGLVLAYLELGWL
jgi:sodium-dependent dicarboxylate transporter 2/3/5